MPRKKKVIQPESEDDVYERFLKKLLKDPRFKQYKPMAIKALAARGIGGGGGRGRGGGGRGRGGGMIQTPNQDNFIKIHSAILDSNAKLAEFANQMKRGLFDIWAAQQGYQGNSQPSGNYAPPTAENAPLSLNEHRTYSRSSLDLSRDDLLTPIRRLEEAEQTEFHDVEYDQGIQGNAEPSPSIPRPEAREMGTQSETRMYDTADMLSVMSHGSIASRLKAHGFNTRGLPAGVDTLRESTSQLYKDEFQKQLEGVAGAIDLNLLQSGQRGRPRLNDPVLEEVEVGEND